jgi:hypothetical protein
LIEFRKSSYLLVKLSGFVILANELLILPRGFFVILKTGFIIFFIGFEELNPVIPVEFVLVAFEMDSAVAFL